MNTSAPIVEEILTRIVERIFPGAFCDFLPERSLDNPGVTQINPSVAPNESCKLREAAAKGLLNKIQKSAVAKAVGASLFRRKIGAISKNISITQARTIDGLAPVKSA